MAEKMQWRKKEFNEHLKNVCLELGDLYLGRKSGVLKT